MVKFNALEIPAKAGLACACSQVRQKEDMASPIECKSYRTLEQRIDDIRAVMNAVGIERALLFGVSENGSICALFAATYPQRTTALVIYGAFAKRLLSKDYPWGPTLEEKDNRVQSLEKGWDGRIEVSGLASSAARDEQFAK